MYIHRLLNVIMTDYRVYTVLCFLLWYLTWSHAQSLAEPDVEMHIQPNLAPAGFEKIKSGVTLVTTTMKLCTHIPHGTRP